MAMLGMDLDQIQSMITRLVTERDNLSTSMNAIDGLISQNIPTNWTGDDATAFQTAWQSERRRSLQQAIDLLQEAIDVAGRDLDAQRQTSSRQGA